VKNKLKDLRALQGMTQADLATALDVSRQTINALENGRFDPSLPLAFKIGRLFKMPVEAIFEDAP
jgi:putative transcriptional regulator